MWYYNGQVIKTPKEMQINGIRYPKQIFRDSATLSSLGITSYSEETVNERYYWRGTKTVNANGHATFTTTAKDVDNLKSDMTQKVKTAVAARLQPTDWRIIREAEGGTAAANTYLTYRSGIRSEGNTKETEIDALSTIDDIIAYENAPFTEVRYAAHANGDINTAETVSSTRSIDKCTYFTSTDPDAEADEWFVSLTED